MNALADILKINVGFIIHQTAGYSRDIPLEAERIHLPPDVILNDLNGVARVTRTTHGLLVQVKVAASADAECGRCLSEMRQPLEVDFTDLWAFTPDQMTESGFRVPDSGQIDLGPIIREEMLIAMPITSVCREDCLGLCPICGENLNDIAQPHTHPEEEEV